MEDGFLTHVMSIVRHRERESQQCRRLQQKGSEREKPQVSLL